MRLCVVLLTVAIAASAATLEAQKTLADGVKDLAAQISASDLASQLGINCRLIDTATGEIFAAAQTKITKDDDVKKIMGPALPGNAAPSTRKRSPAATARSWERGGVRYTVESAQRNERTVELLVVLEHDKPENVRESGPVVLDDNGDHWSSGFDSKGILMYGGVTLLPGLASEARFLFASPSPTPTAPSSSAISPSRKTLMSSSGIM